MKRIEITITTKGLVKVETSGFVGSDCKTASSPYERALGLISNQVHKSEYFQNAEQSQQAENRA